MKKKHLKSTWKICLINPPVLCPKNQPWVDLFQPLGLAYLAAILRKNNYPVSIIDAAALGWKNLQEFDENRNFNGLDYKKIGQIIKKLKPKIVGITITFTIQKDSAFRTASVVKSVDKNIIVIVGGPHVTVRAGECLKNPNIDFAVIGEGEETIIELVKKIENKIDYRALTKVKGIVFKDKKKIVFTSNRPLLENLDALPFPARDLLPMTIYFEAARLKRASRDLDKPWASVITSRGCPYNCVFCSVHLSMGRLWRFRSPENIIEELRLLIRDYKIKQIDFEDDNISFNKKRMVEICDLIVKNNFGIEWFTPNGIRVDTLDEPLLRKMKISGCRELWFAPESGSQRVVDEIIGKGINLKYVKRMVVACKKIGISSNCFFVIGLPGETKREIKKSISFAQELGRLGADNCLFSIATPLYGTRLYRQAVEKGLLVKNIDKALSYDQALIKTPEFTPQDLMGIRKQATDDNRRLYVKNSFSKLLYYLFNNPILAIEHLKNMFKIGTIFLRRHHYHLLNKNIRKDYR